MHIGLYFGSFNPIHIGHCIIASHVVNNTGLDNVWLVVSPENPFKQSSTLLNEYHRLHLVNLAIEEEEKLKACDIEFYLPKPSYTIHTLAYLKEKYPQHTFSVVMGSDSFQNILKWKNGEVIVRDYELIVYTRPGFEVQNDIGARLTILDAPLLEISSTQIRADIKQGKSVRFLLPEKVRQEILLNRYYK